MVGGRPTVDLPRTVRARIEARTGDTAFVVPNFHTSLEKTAANLRPTPHHVYLTDIPPRDVGLEARLGRGCENGRWLLVSVGDEIGHRP